MDRGIQSFYQNDLSPILNSIPKLATATSELATKVLWDIGHPHDAWNDLTRWGNQAFSAATLAFDEFQWGLTHPQQVANAFIQDERNLLNRAEQFINEPWQQEVQDSVQALLAVGLFVITRPLKIIRGITNLEVGAEGLDRIPFDRKAITEGFQDHHIISPTNQLTKDHELLDLADFDIESRANKIFLPTDESLHPTRSIHLGRHTTAAIQMVHDSMQDVLSLGKSQGWSQAEYQEALHSMLQDFRQQLKTGDIALNKNMRPWANRPGF